MKLFTLLLAFVLAKFTFSLPKTANGTLVITRPTGAFTDGTTEVSLLFC